MTTLNHRAAAVKTRYEEMQKKNYVTDSVQVGVYCNDIGTLLAKQKDLEKRLKFMNQKHEEAIGKLAEPEDEIQELEGFIKEMGERQE